MRPPPALDYNAWSEQERQVAVGTSATPGRWRSQPYQGPVMAALSDPRADGVLFVACSQGGGKTEICLNAVGYHVAHDPASVLVVEPNLEMAEALSKDRLAPMIAATPALRACVPEPRSRDSGNTLRHKIFPGGHVTIVGANSAAGLAMRPIRVLVADEIDRYPASAGSEGDPLNLAEARTTSFWNARKLYVSSPGNRGTSRSEVLWERSDQAEYEVPCPDCGQHQPLVWANVQWDRGDQGEHLPETASYVCEHCGSCWDDVTRWRASRRGEFRQRKPFVGLYAFRMNALGVIGRKLEPIVKQWLAAQGKPELLRVFVNTVLAEWYEEKYEKVDEKGIRREPFPERDGIRLAPMGVAVLTAGVDLQDNRIEVAVDGWGSEEEWWRIEHHVLDGDPSSAALWADLWRLLSRPRQMERGGEDYIRATGVDTGGHHTQMAYAFCRPRIRVQTQDGRLAYVFALKGQDGPGQVWPRDASRNNIAKIPLWNIKVDSAKELLYARLQKVLEPGPGYIHIPDSQEFGERWAKQLTAEKVTTKTNTKGYPVRVWSLRSAGMRNEALDTSVYSYAALCGLRAMGLDLEQECEALEARPVFHAPPPEDLAAPPPAQRPATRKERRGGRWVDERRDWMR